MGWVSTLLDQGEAAEAAITDGLGPPATLR
jgi:hypothetical protein